MKLLLHIYHENMRHFKQKEHCGEVCVLRHGAHRIQPCCFEYLCCNSVNKTTHPHFTYIYVSTDNTVRMQLSVLLIPITLLTDL